MDLIGHALAGSAAAVFEQLASIPEDERIDVINEIRLALREHSPMKGEPVDCVLWVPADQVRGNEYNPNQVAPPEMKLLNHSIEQDGYTQPVVSWPADDGYEVVDGFHRNRVGKENPRVRERVRGRLPVTVINGDRAAIEDRQAATIRHNRARGQHTVEGMSDIVVFLSRKGKNDEWIARELGMDADEVTRLRQVSGLAEMFAGDEFSEAWEAERDRPWTTEGNAAGSAPPVSSAEVPK
jgi:ParB-like chromosome segregation protein Spo0J